MNLTPFTSLTWAYQLHYYLCFRTRRRRTLFSFERQVNLLSQLIQEISANHDYRLLEHKSYPTELRCLFSLRPSQGATIGQALTEYWLGVAAKREFALDQISIVPDHIHMIVRIVPKKSIEEVVLMLMNNGQYFIGKRYPELLVHLGMTQLWNKSAYAGTCGEITTGL